MSGIMQMVLARNQMSVAVADVFSTYLYDGTSGAQTITNGIDLSTKGGMVWIKKRTNADLHTVYDTTRGATKVLQTHLTNAESTETSSLTAFNVNGFSIGSWSPVNNAGNSWVSWSFRKAAKFFDVQPATVTGGVDATVSFSDLSTLGCVIVKRTDSTGSWYVWHRSLSAGKLLYLEQAAAEATLGHVTVSGTTVTLEGGVIANGTYIVYAFAHDTGGIIQCGSFTTDGSGNATVNHGWSGSQYVMIKGSSTTGDWEIYDTARTSGFTGDDARLRANLANAEDSVARISASGSTLSFAGLTASKDYIYMVIKA